MSLLNIMDTIYFFWQHYLLQDVAAQYNGYSILLLTALSSSWRRCSNCICEFDACPMTIYITKCTILKLYEYVQAVLYCWRKFLLLLRLLPSPAQIYMSWLSPVVVLAFPIFFSLIPCLALLISLDYLFQVSWPKYLRFWRLWIVKAMQFIGRWS